MKWKIGPKFSNYVPLSKDERCLHLLSKNLVHNIFIFLKSVFSNCAILAITHLLLVIFTLLLARILLHVHTKTSKEPSDSILSKHIALVPQANGFQIDEFDCKNQSTYINYVRNVQILLAEYKDENLYPAMSSKRRFNLTLLGECGIDGNYGFDTGKPCIYFSIGKILNFIPNTTADIIPINCSQNISNSINKIIPSPAGILKKHLPYKLGEFGVYPLVAIKISSTHPSIIQCRIKDDNILTSQKYSPEKAVGTMEIFIAGTTSQDCG